MKTGDEVGLRNQSPIQPSSREHVSSLRDLEVLEYGFNKIVCWITCLEKRNYFRSSLFSFNHVITQSNLKTRRKWGLEETNRSFEEQVALGLSVMELQLGSICRFSESLKSSVNQNKDFWGKKRCFWILNSVWGLRSMRFKGGKMPVFPSLSKTVLGKLISQHQSWALDLSTDGEQTPCPARL